MTSDASSDRRFVVEVPCRPPGGVGKRGVKAVVPLGEEPAEGLAMTVLDAVDRDEPEVPSGFLRVELGVVSDPEEVSPRRLVQSGCDVVGYVNHVSLCANRTGEHVDIAIDR